MRVQTPPLFALVERSQNHMATTFELKVSCAEEKAGRAVRVLEDCHALIEELESELTEFRPESPVARLNEAKTNERIEFPASAWELLELSHAIEELSGGAFTVVAKSTGKEPKLLHKRIGLDAESRCAWRLDPGAHLGFGAIGKGYALDRCRAELALAGFDEFCLTGGGSSILLSGSAPEGRPWSWGWSWSKDEQGASVGLEFTRTGHGAIAIGVSGLHEKGLHLIDPRGPKTRAEGLQSALVTHPSAAWADALSTALFVAGWDEALKRFSACVQAPGLAVIDGEGVPRWNGVFQGLFGPIT